eukprot:scaffold55841_cov55-Phaeocystis_antarctica.AAC.2
MGGWPPPAGRPPAVARAPARGRARHWGAPAVRAAQRHSSHRRNVDSLITSVFADPLVLVSHFTVDDHLPRPPTVARSRVR